MAERSLRFSVATDDGRTSDIWKCGTILGTGKRDVYMTSKPLGHALKLSLHEGGQWHIGFDANKKDKLFDPDRLPPTRFLGKWERPDSAERPFVLAARWYVPWFAPSTASRDAPLSTVWIPSAPIDRSVEVAVFLVNADFDRTAWPGRDALGD